MLLDQHAWPCISHVPASCTGLNSHSSTASHGLRACSHCSVLCNAVMVDKHPVGIILLSNTIKAVRFEVSKEHWRGTAHYARLPAMVVGSFEKWGGRSKEDGVVEVEWESDGSNSKEHLTVLLRPELGLKLLPYLNGKTAPRAKGATAKRAYAVAVSTGPYAPEVQDESQTVEVCYGPVESRVLHPYIHCISPWGLTCLTSTCACRYLTKTWEGCAVYKSGM